MKQRYYSEAPIPFDKIVFHLQGDNYVAGNVDTSIARWSDSSGNGNHFELPISTANSNRPTVVANGLNGYSTVGFNGTQWLQRTGIRYTEWTTFVVAKTLTPTTRQCIIGTYDAINNSSLSHCFEISNTANAGSNASGKLSYMWSSGGNVSAGYANLSLISNIWFNSVQIVSSSDIKANYYNNLSSITVTSNTTGIANNTSSTNWAIGRLGVFNGVYFAGEIAEILFYSRKLSETEIIQTQKYLKLKYGI